MQGLFNKLKEEAEFYVYYTSLEKCCNEQYDLDACTKLRFEGTMDRETVVIGTICEVGSDEEKEMMGQRVFLTRWEIGIVDWQIKKGKIQIGPETLYLVDTL